MANIDEKREDKRDNIEVRLHKDGTLDEIVMDDPHTGQCLFHLEQMDDYYFWMRCYGITQDLVVHFGAVMGMRNGKPICDEKGFVKGYEQFEGAKVSSDFHWDDPTKESETAERFQTPAIERRNQIAEIVNKYGVACVLQEIADIYKEGRKADHEQELIANLTDTERKFRVGEKKYWDARIAEDNDKNRI